MTRFSNYPNNNLQGLQPSGPQNVSQNIGSNRVFWCDRDPTTNDFDNWFIGSRWISYVAATPRIFILTRKEIGAGHIKTATWTRLLTTTGSIGYLEGDTGGAVGPDGTDIIHLESGITGLSVDGNPATYTLTLNSADGEPLLQSLRGDGNIKVYPTGAGYIDLKGAAGQITTTEDVLNRRITFGIDNGTDGQVLIGGGTAATWATLTQGANVTITNGPNSVTIAAAAGPGGDITLVGNDASTATSVANTLNVLGSVGRIETSGDGANTFTIDIDNGTDGQVLIGGGTAATWATLTNGNNITCTGGTNSIEVAVSGTTDHRVQIGNAAGSLTSLGSGSSGQVLTSQGAADPVWTTSAAGGGTVFSRTGRQLAQVGYNPLFHPLDGSGPPGSPSTAFETPMPTAGTFSNLYVQCYDMASTIGVTVTLYVNGVATALAVTVPASTTGTFSDIIDTVNVNAGDLVCYGVSAPNNSNVTANISVLFG